MEKIKKILHNLLKWGYPYPRGTVGRCNLGDDFQPTYPCRFCGIEITQDSQGNWFHLEDY